MDNPIEIFLKLPRYNKSRNTNKNYRCTLTNYFRIINKQPEGYFDKPDMEQYKKDVNTYWESQKEHPPKTKDARLFCIKAFFIRNSIEIPTKFWKELREETQEQGTVGEDILPRTEDLRSILAHANARERAWILTCCSSGIRIGELLKLDESYLYLDEQPPRIFLPGKITKEGYKRDIFISDESKQALKEWIRVKKDYILKLNNKNHFKYAKNKTHDENTTLLFPFVYETLKTKWNQLLTTTNNAQQDTRTRHRKMHIHTLRKWAKTRMLLTMPESMVNSIIGHKDYMGREYKRFEVVQIAPHYKLASPNLSVFETTTGYGVLSEEVKTLKDENVVLRNEMQLLMAKVLTLSK